MTDIEAINQVKNKLLLNLDAQLQSLRYRFGVNSVIRAAAIDHELTNIKVVLSRICQLHDVIHSLKWMDRCGINRPIE